MRKTKFYPNNLKKTSEKPQNPKKHLFFYMKTRKPLITHSKTKKTFDLSKLKTSSRLQNRFIKMKIQYNS